MKNVECCISPNIMLQGTLQDIFSRKSYQINCYLELRAQLCLSANLLGVGGNSCYHTPDQQNSKYQQFSKDRKNSLQ
jgi:hypothetical protein